MKILRHNDSFYKNHYQNAVILAQSKGELSVMRSDFKSLAGYLIEIDLRNFSDIIPY